MNKEIPGGVSVVRGALGVEKVAFLNTPTPLHRLDRMSRELGVEFYLKRDDLTCLGTGGNKLRKLEYFVRDALDQGATMLLTVGGAQTNHGRLTAATAARFGLRSAIVAVDPYPGEMSANLLLDGIMDCHVYLVKSREGEDYNTLLNDAVARVTAEWEAAGEKVYFIPMGGSNELGALGYYDCALELADQVRELELADPHVFVTVGSLGTYTGLAVAFGKEKIPMKLTGVGIAPFPDLTGSAVKHFNKVVSAYGLDLEPEGLDLTGDYDFGDYNNPVKEVREAIYAMGRAEGIILDPCYTGKTFNAIRQMLREGKISRDETVIMIHTGGIPGIYTGHHRVEREKELLDHIHIVEGEGITEV